ncbi:MAG: lipocalin-like domain-containing protein [Gemmatimonadota bacterium]|nr:lipocalin-like domain-containing protein [Gemmatimonadota bacterium]
MRQADRPQTRCGWRDKLLRITDGGFPAGTRRALRGYRIWITARYRYTFFLSSFLPFLLSGFLLSSPTLAQPTKAFKQAIPPYTFQFPQDHASHPAYQTEWWYYTGHLQSNDRIFGYELTFFRVGINPNPQPGGSRWRMHTLYFAHFALTDEDGEQFFHKEEISRPALDMAGARENRFQVWINDWSAELADSAAHRIRASADFASIALDLVPAKPPVIHGHDGVSQKSPGVGRASHYYSLTRLQTTGTLTFEGETFEVTGLSWMDHEFGSNQLSDDQKGWDWFSLQLDNNRELMLFVMRRKDGTYEPTSSGTMIYTDGTWRHLSLEMFEIEATGAWTSPHSGGTYPHAWRIAVPSEQIELRLTPTVSDQELGKNSLIGVIYWEGSVVVRGTDQGRPVTGQGYVELTGYRGRVPGL